MSQYLRSLKEVRQFDNLEFLAKQVVEGFMVGLHKSPFHGYSVEFAEHRLYNPGESIKHLDWKVFARTDRMYVKRYEEETNLRCQLVLDVSNSMFFPKGEHRTNKMHFSAVSAAALMEMMQKQRDAVGLTLLADKIEEWIPATSNRANIARIYHNLEQLIQGESEYGGTKLSSNLHVLAEQLPNRSLIVLLTDGLAEENSEELIEALRHLTFKKHEVILCHIMDSEYEMDFKFPNRPLRMIDMETGQMVKVQPHAIKEEYRKMMEAKFKALDLACRKLKIDRIEADIRREFGQILFPYLKKRSKK